MVNIVGAIPDFTTDETPKGEPEVKQEVVVEQPEEKETPASPPDEKPLESEPLKETPAPLHDDKLQQAVDGLQRERVKLLQEISELRGQKREIKQDALQKVEEKIDELKDLHPDDVNVIDKVLRAKGYMTRHEADQMFYEAVKNEELTKFLTKYPEYKPENDKEDVNWKTLQNEFGLYRRPENPRQIGELLERAHKSIVRIPTGQNIPAQKRVIEVASKGSGGVQRPSTTKSFDAKTRAMYENGGWTEDEIKAMESRL